MRARRGAAEVPLSPNTSAPQSLVFAPAEVAARVDAAQTALARGLGESVVLAFVGAASAGKDAGIRALFGVDFGEVDPIPGSTDRLRAVALDAAGQVIVVNAPGFGDLRAEVAATSQSLLHKLDLAVYVVNADGGATADDKAHLAALRALQRPVLVVLNKIDLIRPHQKDEFVRTTFAQLGVAPEDGVVAAFDPLPALSDKPIGLDGITEWIVRTLSEQGKAMLFARQLRDKALACESLIKAAARRSALAGAIPVPGADVAAVTAVQVQLITEIAAIYARRMDRDLALFIVGEALAGSGKGFVRWATNALKAAGWIPGGQLGEVAASALGAAVSSAATYGVGRAAVAYMEKESLGLPVSGADIRAVFETFARQARGGGVPGIGAAPAAALGAGDDVLDAEIEPAPLGGGRR